MRRGDDPDAGERPWNRWLERSGERVGGSGSGMPGNGPSGNGQPGNGPPGPEPPPLWGTPAPDRSQQQGRPPSIRVWTIAELTRAIRDVLRGVDRFRDVWVEGEIGQVSVSAAGHAFFVLRDDRTQLNCVFFQRERLASPFEPQTGLRVVVHGRVDVYEPGGAYQLYVDALQPAGFGDLALRFEALKARLAAEGLFDAARRQPLPAVPRVVGVATSATGAVLHDIRRVLARRWPLTRLVLAPCLVQGDAAPESIVAALRRLARWEDAATGEAVDVVILARGGGSAEDLWAFNDERVVRAVAACPVPLVTGVGHETDVTLVDFAADVRAPTPSAAAELVTPSREAARERLREARRRLGASAGADARGPAPGPDRRAAGAHATPPRGGARRRSRGGGPAPGAGAPGRRCPLAGGRAPARPGSRPVALPGGRTRRPGGRGRPGGGRGAGGPVPVRHARPGIRDRPRRPRARAPRRGGCRARGPARCAARERVAGRPGRPRARLRAMSAHTPGPAEAAGAVTAAATPPGGLPPVETLTFDAALAELQDVVGQLESGNLPLEEAIAAFERGVQLHERCARLLDEAELRVQRLVEEAGGALRAVELDSDEPAGA